VTKRNLRILEFAIAGITMGMIEDLLAVALTSDTKIDLRVIGIVLLITIPFAFVSEFIVDHPRFWESIFKVHPLRKKKK